MERGEQLSALLDGELDELATARLLRAMEQDAQPLAAWEEYTLIGEALRDREGPGLAGCAGARRALAQIARESAPQRGWAARVAGWRPALPWAVAASAALAAFLFGAPGVPDALVAWIGGSSASAGAERLAGGADPMARYIDYHREVAGPGFERTAFAVVDGGSGQGR